MARAWARRSRSSPTGGFPGRRAGCASVMCRQNRSSGARWRWCAKATASGSMPLHAAWIFLLTTRNSQSGEKPGSLDRRGIARARSPNTRVWSGRRLVAPSPTLTRRLCRGSIGPPQRTDARHEELREREALMSQSRHPDALHGVKGGLHTAEGDDRLGSAEKTFDACVGPEITIKGKGGGVSPPARQWMLCRGLMGFCDGNKGRRARTSVQIFVSATDREVDGIKVECDFHHADRMAEVPHHQRAGVVQLFGNGGHVK